MIEDGIKPENILMFTFTRKAAGEIKERVSARIGKKGERITVGTYHSVCSRFLRKYAEYLGYEKNFSIYDEDDKLKVLKEIVTDDRLKPNVVANYISRWKGQCLSPIDALERAENSFEEISAEYYQKYQDMMLDLNALDFDDLIYQTVRLFKNYPEVLEEVQDRYRYIISDESHDSGIADIELIKLLGDKYKNVCLILDDEQSIYGFRGAAIETVLRLKDYFPDLKEYILRQNYRSTQTIVKAARSLIEHNTGQIEKEIFTENEVGEKIVYFECANQAEEATKAVALIKALLREDSVSHKDIAILYRMSYLSRTIEEALLSNGIPYEVVGGLPFYGRKEIKDIMSYVRFIYNPQDKQAFERIVNIPKRGIGKKSLEKIYHFVNHMQNDKLDLEEACKQVELTGKAKQGIQDFNNIISTLKKEVDNGITPEELIRTIVKLIGYNQYLIETEKKEAEEKIANVIELISIASQYDTLDDFIYNMALNSDIDKEEDDEESDDKIQLLTMHASKGLEYKAVIIVGANEGISPHWRADTLKELEEERRLFYVAMTRAKKFLFITRPKIVNMNGSPMYSKESRFIEEIDSKYLHIVR